MRTSPKITGIRVASRRTASSLLVLGLLLTACGGGGGSEVVDRLVEEGATQEEAECFVDAVGEDQAQLIADNLDADEPPEGVDLEAVTDGLIECGVDALE